MNQQSENNQNEDNMDLARLYGAWFKMAADFWENFSRTQPEKEMVDFFSQKQKGPSHELQQAWERGSEIAAAVLGMLGDPENLDALFKATDSVPEIIARTSRQVWESFCETQKCWMKQAAEVGNQEKISGFESLDQETFEAFRKIYEKEFQRFFYVPQIGLARYYQERANKAVDKYNLFQSSLSEFIYMFYVPLEKSLGVLQEKIREMVREGEIKDDFKEYYSMWIKILESQYMKVLQSPEYTEVLGRTISSLVTYRNARDEMMYDLLKHVPVPTNREMDELYEEFYELKKKVRELSKKVDQ